MSYRTLTIDGAEYKYSIGKAGVKIVHPAGNTEYQPKSVVGIEYGTRTGKFILTPGMIAAYVKNGTVDKNPANYFDSCNHSDRPRTLLSDPFDVEIRGKKNYWYACDQCYVQRADDI